ncbi:hypothetical protein [Eubacterium sp. An3]|uniref:hypothetical protein n=1 Tax=Eubacterium sp. An3 TaxID=1965628 RepID=UPI000B3A7280|nr:hypothetical protein [Eubacterium sp. An3]OUO26538.1 hypothetical protein B5F87_13505 [Eubacterium sp. An3]
MTKEDFRLQMRITRNAYMRAKKKEDALYNLLEKEFDTDNAEKLHETISRYLLYGECDFDSLWEELQA